MSGLVKRKGLVKTKPQKEQNWKNNTIPFVACIHKRQVKNNRKISWAWWCIPTFWRLRQEDHEFKARLDYIGRSFPFPQTNNL
jgi:hypothetical protein